MWQSSKLGKKCKNRHDSTRGPARVISFAVAFWVIICRTGLRLLRAGQAISMIQSSNSLEESLSCTDRGRKALCQELFIEQTLQGSDITWIRTQREVWTKDVPPVVGISEHWPKQKLKSCMMKWSGLAELELELTARLIWAGIREVGKPVFGKKVCYSSYPVLSVCSAVTSIKAWWGRGGKQVSPGCHSSDLL